MEIPLMKEVTIHSLNTKLRKINRNYPWAMPDCLKIVLMITSTIIGIVSIVIIIYLRRTGNCMLSGKHLNKRRKLKPISQHSHDKGIAMKELNCPPNSTVSRPLSSISTNNSLKSLAQRELPQLPNTSQNLPDSPLLQYYWAKDKEKYKWPTEGFNLRIPTTQRCRFRLFQM